MKLEPLLPVRKNSKKTFVTEWSVKSWGALAEELQQGRDCNQALRLDLFFVVDPDDEAAETFCNELDATGELPTTVTYRTWRGHTIRLYNPPPGRGHEPLNIQEPFRLELRTGSGQYCLIPPSTIFDPETKRSGQYVWVTGHSPEDIEPADFPPELYERLKEMAKATGPNQQTSPDHRLSKATLNFEKGSRDDSIYSVALALRKGGMPEANIMLTIKALASTCNPPFSEKEAAIKVKAAMKLTPGERNLKNEIMGWVDLTDGVFSISELDRDLEISDKRDKSARRLILFRAAEAGKIKRIDDKAGIYCKVDTAMNEIDYAKADPENILPVKWPFRLHNYVNIYGKNIIVVAGASNSGKSAFCLNTAAMNCGKHRVKYFSSEMGAEELKIRLQNFDTPLSFWEPVKFYDRSFDFSTVIDPGAINIIDYLEISDNFFQVGAEIKAIFDKLQSGIALIALQKKKGAEYGRGAEFSLEKSRLYLSMDSNILKIIKAKNWAQSGVNPNNMEFRFKLAGGCKFIDQ